MFEKIKSWIKEKVDLVFNTVIEVKMWVCMLMTVLLSWQAIKMATYILTKAPMAVAGFTCVYAISLLIGLLVLTVIMSFGVVDIRIESRPNWRVVS